MAEALEVVSGALKQRLQSSKLPGYIAIEGPIGIGKTTLSRRLAETFGYQTLLEPVADNPFLRDFYQHRGRNALATQLYFLLSRARQVSDIRQQDLIGTQLISDFLLDKDDLFARMNLSAQEYGLYQQIHASLDLAAPQPDLVVYLQAPAPKLLERVRTRGIDFEQHIDAGYLETLIDAYTEFFHFYDAAPLLIVNASEMDLSHNPAHFEALVERMLAMDSAREYFNPNPTLL